MDIEAIKARLEAVRSFPVGSDSKCIEFLHGGRRDEATNWALHVRKDEADLLVEVGHLQHILKALVDIYVKDRFFVRTQVSQTPDIYAAWQDAIKVVYGSEDTNAPT